MRPPQRAMEGSEDVCEPEETLRVTVWTVEALTTYSQ